jgi:hypothetical protein
MVGEGTSSPPTVSPTTKKSLQKKVDSKEEEILSCLYGSNYMYGSMCLLGTLSFGGMDCHLNYVIYEKCLSFELCHICSMCLVSYIYIAIILC